MFTFGQSSFRQAAIVCSSVALHLLVLGWLLYAVRPKFLAPFAVMQGQNGTSIARLYWDSRSAGKAPQTLSTAAHHVAAVHRPLTWQKKRAALKQQLLVSPTPEAQAQPEPASASQLPAAPPAGVPYGTLWQGPRYGEEIRPALPIVATDPVVDPAELPGGTEGSVVVEITIDEKGSIVQEVVLQSLGTAIDSRVLAALENWRFRPATRNGVAIPSKQDVYYHFRPHG